MVDFPIMNGRDKVDAKPEAFTARSVAIGKNAKPFLPPCSHDLPSNGIELFYHRKRDSKHRLQWPVSAHCGELPYRPLRFLPFFVIVIISLNHRLWRWFSEIIILDSQPPSTHDKEGEEPKGESFLVNNVQG